MYFQDHNPPHFHAEYQGATAEYSILTLEILVGRLPNRAHAMVLEWAAQHRDELIKNWELASVPETLMKIQPLS